VQSKEVDLNKVKVIWRSPAYYDYHWLINPQVKSDMARILSKKVQKAFKARLTCQNKRSSRPFRSQKVYQTKDSNYVQIEAIGREIGKIKQ
jgi:phosphonate transport system substrate-binding protein